MDLKNAEFLLFDRKRCQFCAAASTYFFLRFVIGQSFLAITVKECWWQLFSWY